MKIGIQKNSRIVDKFIKKAAGAKDIGGYGKALKLYKQAFHTLCRMAGVYADEKMGETELEFINRKYDNNKNEAYEQYTADAWCLAFESDEELAKFEKDQLSLKRECLRKDKRIFLICQELVSVYRRINCFQDAKIWFDEAARLLLTEK